MPLHYGSMSLSCEYRRIYSVLQNSVCIWDNTYTRKVYGSLLQCVARISVYMGRYSHMKGVWVFVVSIVPYTHMSIVPYTQRFCLEVLLLVSCVGVLTHVSRMTTHMRDHMCTLT